MEKQAYVDQLLAYDTAVQSRADGSNRRLKYLFPWAGPIAMNASAYDPQHAIEKLSPSQSAYYASRLPGVQMLPSVDSGDGDMLSTWSQADQQKLADDIAQYIQDDPNARGVMMDIEPYDGKHLPLYQRLRARLNPNGKIVAVFTSETSGPIYDNVDWVVLSGYDVGATAPSNYATILADKVSEAIQSAQSAGSYLMVGIPASASWEEYASATGSSSCSMDTGFTQEQWLGAALKAVCPHHFDDHYLGVSLWQVTDVPLDMGACDHHPDEISTAAYSLVEQFDPNHCP